MYTGMLKVKYNVINRSKMERPIKVASIVKQEEQAICQMFLQNKDSGWNFFFFSNSQ